MRFRQTDVTHTTRVEGGFGRGDLRHDNTGITVVYSWHDEVAKRENLARAMLELEQRVLDDPRVLGAPTR